MSSAPFLFSVVAPEPSLRVGASQAGASLGDRALLLSTGAAFDPGITVETRLNAGLVVRAMTGRTELVAGAQRFATFQQVEVLRRVMRRPGLDLSVGGGLREEWGGTRTYIGRAVAGVAVGGGLLAGNAVVEKAAAAGRDRVDLITTVGWSRAIGGGWRLGVEGIGQDLEGFWSREEAEGGARLLVGPSLQVAGTGRWVLNVAGGPMFHSTSVVARSDAPRGIPAGASAGHFAVLASFTCVVPSLR